MATAREQALQSLRDMGYSQGQINSAIQQVKSQQSQGQTASQIKSNIQNNSSTYFGGSAMYGSGGSSSSSSSSSAGGSGLTNKDTSSNTNAGDIYGDVGGNRTGATPMDFSNASGTIDEASLSFGANAAAKQAKNSNYLSNRNNDIASYLYALNKDKGGEVDRNAVKGYLDKFKDFTDAEEWEQNNTIDAILARYGEVKKEKEKTDTGVTGVDETSLNDTKKGATSASDGFYLDKDGNEVKIYGYDELDDFYKGLIDREDNETRKYLSNLWAQGMQEKVKYFLDAKREEKQIKDVQDIKKELHDIDMQEFAIQQAQTIRNAEESYNNLKQNWQYLGNLGMPGTSATKIQAIGDCITEAKTQLNELNKLLDLQKSGKETEWKGQVLNYTQQMENIAYDLKWKVGDELTGLLSKFTTAELEGKLDTIDGITAFRKDLLDELDKNLSGITSASLSQMQYLNQEYQKLADKAEEYVKNSNAVNSEMSLVKGFYVDNNGNPILDNNGNVIKTQGTDWMEPVFDKETGKLITFTYDENGNRTADVVQLWDGETNTVQGKIASLLQQGKSVADILYSVPGADIKTIKDIATVMGMESVGTGGGIGGYNYGGGNQTADTRWSKGNQEKLGEEAIDTGYKSVLTGNPNVKLAPTVWNKLSGAIESLKSQGIDLKIGDSYRSTQTQANAYAKDQALPEGQRKGVAAPGTSFHEIGQAFDIDWGQMNDPKVIQALHDAGFTRPVKSEAWHWSYGEGPDVWGGYAETTTSGDNLGFSVIDTYSLAPHKDNTQSQNDTFGFASRMWNADEKIRQYEAKYKDSWGIFSSTEGYLQAIPGLKSGLQFFSGDDKKMYETYQEDFITALLRKESGAAIGPSEYTKEAEKYFPQPGDTDKVIEEKQKLREESIKSKMAVSGKANNGDTWANIYKQNRKNNIYQTNLKNSQAPVQEDIQISEEGVVTPLQIKGKGRGA